MSESNPGRTMFLFLAALGVSGAVGLAVMRSTGGAAEAAEEPVAEPVAKADKAKEAEQAESEKKKDEEPQVAKKAPAKRKVIRWEGGAESDIAARREGMKVWAGPASQAPGRFGGGAAYQPGPNPGPPHYKVKR